MCRAQWTLLPVQYRALMMFDIDGISAIWSLKKGQVFRHSHSAMALTLLIGKHVLVFTMRVSAFVHDSSRLSLSSLRVSGPAVCRRILASPIGKDVTRS